MARPSREPWRSFEAIAEPDAGPDPDQPAADRVERYRLWTRGSEAVLTVDQHGSLVYEARASAGTLRERNYVARHQVLRVGEESVWAVQRVAGPLGAAAEELGPSELRRVELPVGRATLRGLPIEDGSTPPPISRVSNWSWEVYGRLALATASSYAAVKLPSALLNYRFVQAFLFTASTSHAAALHIVWGSGDGEMELVIGNHEGVAAADDDQCRRASGSIRFADFYSDDSGLVDQAAALVRLKEIAAVTEPMPSEASPWRWEWQ